MMVSQMNVKILLLAFILLNFFLIYFVLCFLCLQRAPIRVYVRSLLTTIHWLSQKF